MLLYYNGYTVITSNTINYADIQVNIADKITSVHDTINNLVVFCGRYIYIVCKKQKEFTRISMSKFLEDSLNHDRMIKYDRYTQLILQIRYRNFRVVLRITAKGPFRGHEDIIIRTIH